MPDEPGNRPVTHAPARPRGQEARLEQRLPLAIPIEVSGIDRSGQPFCETVWTIDVSMSGCRFKLTKDLGLDSMVAIRVLRTLSGLPGDTRLLVFQIMYSRRDQGGFVIGAWALQPEVEWCPGLPKSGEP